MKKLFFSILSSILLLPSFVFAGRPDIDCGNLPGCTGSSSQTQAAPVKFIGDLIATGIKYVAVIAVISLMLSGILYLTSGGEEEKVKKAKTWIIWSLVGVLLSVSSWFIINLINNLNIF